MNDSAVENGAEFRRDLTKSVTHLIARNTDGEKYKFAVQWNIKVVTVKWFSDCVERGMTLDEERYHPTLSEEEQGVGAWDRTAHAGKSLSRKEVSASKENPSNPRPRKKLRRTASTKLVDQNENIWGDIIGAGFSNPDTLGPKENEQDDENSEPPKPAIQAAQSFASETTFNESIDNRQLPDTSSKGPVGFLDGTYFYTHGFSSKQVSSRHLDLLCQRLTFIDRHSTSSPWIQRCAVRGLLGRIFSSQHSQDRSRTIHHGSLSDSQVPGPIN